MVRVQDGNMAIFEQTMGTLGLVETWLLVVYGLGSLGPLTSFENVRLSCIGTFGF